MFTVDVFTIVIIMVTGIIFSAEKANKDAENMGLSIAHAMNINSFKYIAHEDGISIHILNIIYVYLHIQYIKHYIHNIYI